MKTIENELTNLLKTSTGTHFLDSGSAYGRHWERNQKTDIENEPRVSYEVYNGEIDFTVSTFHYLSEILDYDKNCEMFNNLINWRDNKPDSDGLYWAGEIAEFLQEQGYEEFYSNEENTYNHENFLSQILQYIVFKYEGETYVILQIHQGCDIRGGYTQGRVFKLNGYLTGAPDIYGDIDGVQVGTSYNGYSLTDDNGNEVKVTEDSEVSLDFVIMEETYMYE